MIDVARQAEVVVVGGGVVGLACARYLRREGLSITVIDRGDFGGACSLGNCGYICPSHVLPLTEPGAFRVALKSIVEPDSPFHLKPRLNPALWRWMIQFARRCTHRQMLRAGVHLKTILDSSMSEYRRLVAEENLQCEWNSGGLLYVLRSDNGMEEFAKTDRLLSEEFGVKAKRIEGAELVDFDPALKPGLAGAFLYEEDAHLRPDTLCQSWQAELESQGVRFVGQCEVSGIEKRGGRVTALETSQGSLPVDRLVLATGAWSVKLGRSLGCDIPIEPGKGYSITTTRPRQCPRQSILFPEHRVGVTPFEEGFRVGSMMEFVGFDESIPEKRIKQLLSAAENYLHTPYTNQEISRWYGWRPMTWDSLPIIGPAPGLTNTFLATGHNMLGMSLATATGKLIAELMTDRTPHLDVTAFSPDRF